jgi:hypothetical protein
MNVSNGFAEQALKIVKTQPSKFSSAPIVRQSLEEIAKLAEARAVVG